MNWKNYLNELSKENKPVIPFIVGPTASGKTSLAIKIAQELNTDIISADSMQIYKYLNIGTAKPTEEEQKLVKHHLIDFVEPDQEYSVANYKVDAEQIIDKFLENDKVPVICGGTGLYINSLTLPYNFSSSNVDQNLRKQLEKIAQTQDGRDKLYEYLKDIDLESANKIHPNNIKRVIRAIEIFKTTGKPKSKLDKEGQKQELKFTPLLLMPNLERAEVYNRINDRVDIMLEQGLLDEVNSLINKYDKNLPSLQAIGYKEFFDYFDGKIPLEEAIRILKRDSRHYAKRQLTWFRKDDRIKKIDLF